VLRADQAARLDATGILRLPGVVDRAAADGMADAVWASLAPRGVDRADRATWPSGFVGQHQALRRRRVFDAFRGPATAAAADAVLGPGTWSDARSWGPALVTFPEPGPWTLPHTTWHVDLPGRGDPNRPAAVRLFGYAADAVPRGGGTVVVEGSHEVVRRLVAAAPGGDLGSSREVRRRLAAHHPWFRALGREGGDRIRQFMTDGDEVDGIRVRVVELTADAGDLVVMLPWTLHNLAPNCSAMPRLMVTHSVYRSA
jgi:Phytanoyl-CoA dioxygenase (PhyH)